MRRPSSMLAANRRKRDALVVWKTSMPHAAQVQYPDDMQPNQIRSMILQKFPDAGKPPTPADEVNRGITNFAKYAKDTASNLPSSALGVATDIAHTVFAPVRTAENI